MKNVCLPNFIGIGAPRTGTTWVYHALCEHPEIYMSVEKEPHYFSWHFDKGLGWYQSLFGNASEKVLLGEYSAHYYMNIDSMRRILETCPNAKLLLCIRKQSEWMLSHFMFKNHYCDFNKFSDYLREEKVLWSWGNYFAHITNILKLGFKDKQLLILLYDELQRDNKKFFKKICSFLGIDSSFIPSNCDVKTNTIIFPRFQYIMTKFHSAWCSKIIRTSNINKRIKKVYRPVNRKSYPTIPKQIERKVQDYFSESNKELGRFLKRPDIEWLS